MTVENSSLTAEYSQNVDSLTAAGLPDSAGVSFNKFAIVCFAQTEATDDDGDGLGRPDWAGDMVAKKACQKAHKAQKAEYESSKGLDVIQLGNGQTANVTRYSGTKAVRDDHGMLAGQTRNVTFQVDATPDESLTDANHILARAEAKVAAAASE